MAMTFDSCSNTTRCPFTNGPCRQPLPRNAPGSKVGSGSYTIYSLITTPTSKPRISSATRAASASFVLNSGAPAFGSNRPKRASKKTPRQRVGSRRAALRRFLSTGGLLRVPNRYRFSPYSSTKNWRKPNEAASTPSRTTAKPSKKRGKLKLYRSGSPRKTTVEGLIRRRGAFGRKLGDEERALPLPVAFPREDGVLPRASSPPLGPRSGPFLVLETGFYSDSGVRAAAPNSGRYRVV